MRWFWLFILGLVLLTAGLYTKRVRTSDAVVDVPRETMPTRPRRSVRPAKEAPSEPIAEPEPEPAPEPEPEPEEQIAQRETREEPKEPKEPEAVEAVAEAESVVEVIEEAVEAVGKVQAAQEVEEVVETIPEPEPVIEPIEPVEPVEEVIEEPIEQAMVESQPIPEIIAPEAAPEPAPEIASESAAPIVVQAEPEPSYERLDDGTIKVKATGTIITGSGTENDPFVLDWVTMRSVERDYNPRQGKEVLPDWLELLDERFVRITGNTLVPVIATTTREVLVMQNPWDGCCIGIPPSPYDAIEVTLNHDVDFGNSAVGYGTVEGLFLLDPYVVDGWVLGLYLIEEGTYRSGEGVPFPDF